MNIGFKSLFFILCMFLMVACVENSSAENKVDSLLLRNRNFPKDTLSLYIKNYGISKLICRIDSSIQSANKWLHKQNNTVISSTEINKMQAVSKHFKLGLDTLVYRNYKKDESVYQLYEFKEGNTEVIFKTIDSLSKTVTDMEALMFKYIGYDISRNSVVVYGGSYNDIPVSYFDSLYYYITKRSFSNENELINLYWFYTQFSMNYPDKSKVPLTYKEMIFTLLYQNDNLPVLISKYLKQDKMKYISGGIDISTAIKVMAYGLYGKQLSFSDNGVELMYLLSLKNSDDGWPSLIGIPNSSDAITTFYAIWSLCQFKNQLLESVKTK